MKLLQSMQIAAAVSNASAIPRNCTVRIPPSVQAFHVLYHSDESVLLGAPTGSGKTISAELAMLRAFSAHPGAKVIYIAPLKV